MKNINFMTKKATNLKKIAKSSQADGRLYACENTRSAKKFVQNFVFKISSGKLS
jgi:hypothetical protein